MKTGTEEVIPVRNRIQQLSNLPSLAIVKYQLIKAMNKESTSIDDISEIIRHDQALASRVIAVANSAFLGYPGKINAIERAVMLLGFDLVRSISLAASIFNVFASQYGNFKQLWAHSYIVATIAASISEKIPGTDKSVCFLSGLLHDIGRLVLFKVVSDGNLSPEVHKLMRLKGESLLNAENDQFKCDHSQAAGWFLESLSYPEEVVGPIVTHHRVVYEGPHKQASDVVSLAEGMSELLYPDSINDGEWTENHQLLLRDNNLSEKFIDDLKLVMEKERELISKFFDL